MISLLKMIGGTWDQAKGYLRLDLDHLQSAINQRWSATFGDDNLLLPATIPGNTTTPLYVANTGPGQTLMFDLVDLGAGVKGILPFSHITPASAASLLLGRGSAAGGGNYQEITVGTGLVMTGQTLSNTGVPGPSGPAGPAGANGALVLLEQHSAATSATLDFTTAITAAYDEYMIEFVNIIPATDAKPFIMRVSTNGGVSYDAGANYYWNAWDFDESASASSGSQTDTSFQLLSTATTQANYSLNGSVKVFNPAGPAYTTFEGMVQSRASTADAHVVQWMTGGTYLNATAVNAIRFLFTTGSITSGTIRMYGISKVAATGGAVGPQGVPGLDGADGTDGLDGLTTPLEFAYGILGVAHGGTGANLSASAAVGDILYADSTTTFARIAMVADGMILSSGNGVGAAPKWSAAVNLGASSSGFLNIRGKLAVSFTLADDGIFAQGISATFPSVITANRIAINYDITSAGSSSFSQTGVAFVLEPGYTGNARTFALTVKNGVASASNMSVGLSGVCLAAALSNCAVSGVSQNGTNGNIGLYGGIGGFTEGNFNFNITAAILGSNGATGNDIFRGYSGTTLKFSITDAGNVTHAGVVTNYKGIATTGYGVPAIYGLDARTGRTTADGAAITLYTTVNSTSVFRLTADIFATAAVTGTAIYTLTWTQNATTQTLVVNSTTINTLATGTDLINPDTATTITAQLTGTFTGTFTVTGLVEQIK